MLSTKKEGWSGGTNTENTEDIKARKEEENVELKELRKNCSYYSFTRDLKVDEYSYFRLQLKRKF